MGQTTGISWCDHTFNPWSGCTKVSEGCKFCYAERDTLHYGLNVFGPKAERQQRAEGYWKQIPKWNKEAIKAGERRRVFVMSLGDFWEDRAELDEPRARMLRLIEDCKALDFLILTKRPENAQKLLERAGFDHWLGGWPPNVWAGVSVENQQRADERIPILLQIRARVRFLSCEPLVEEVDLERIDPKSWDFVKALTGDTWLDCLSGHVSVVDGASRTRAPINRHIHWVIVGGESGAHARPMNPAWAMQLRDQCKRAGVAFWWKQWGKWVPSELIQDGTAKRPVRDAEGELMSATSYTEGHLFGEARRELPKSRLMTVEVGK